MANLQTAAEATASGLATKGTYGGTMLTIGGWAVNSEFIALCGLALAFLGFVVNLVFKIREDRRQEEAHKLNKRNMEETQTTALDLMRRGAASEGYGGMPKIPAKHPPIKPDDGDT
jgi:hypothetical protein